MPSAFSYARRNRWKIPLNVLFRDDLFIDEMSEPNCVLAHGQEIFDILNLQSHTEVHLLTLYAILLPPMVHHVAHCNLFKNFSRRLSWIDSFIVNVPHDLCVLEAHAVAA